MKRYLWRVVLLLLAMTLLSIGLWVKNDYFTLHPLERSVMLKSPTRVLADHDSLYIITRSKEGLVKYHRDGSWEYDIDVPTLEDLEALTPTIDSPDKLDPTKLNADNFYLRYGDAVPDGQGGLYTLVQVLDDKALVLKYEVLYHYDAQGEIDPSWGVHIRKYDTKKNASLRTGTTKALQMNDGQFTYISQEEGELRWNRWDDVLHKFVTSEKLAVPSNLYLSEVLGSKPADLLYTTQQGVLYKRGGQQLYPLANAGTSDTAFVENIQTDARGEVWFLDPYGKSVKRLDPTRAEGVQTMLDVPQVEQELGKSFSHGNRKSASFSWMNVAPDGTLMLILEDHLILASADGHTQTLDYSTHILTKQWVYWGGLVLLALLFGWLGKILYRDIMPKSIILKQVFILFPLVALCMSGLAVIVQFQMNDITDTEVRRSMEYVVQDAEGLVHPEKLANINSPRDFMSPDYQALTADMQKEEHDGRYYTMVHKVEGDRAYSVYEDDNDFRMFDSFTLTTDDDSLSSCKMYNKELNMYETLDQTQFNTHLTERKLVTCQSEDENGTWLFALGPLFDTSKTKLVGVFEAGVNMHSYQQDMEFNRYVTLLIVAVFTILILVVIFLVTWLQLRRITTLKESVNQLKTNPEETRTTWVEDNSQDQVGELGRSFNEMASAIQANIEQTKKVRDAYKRYFPENLEAYLGKEITALDLGDQKVLERMTVLVINIRNFHQEVKDPAGTYDLINNRFLKHVSEEITKHGGMIGKFMEAGVIALFPQQPADAYRAAVGMCHRLQRQIPSGVGVGVHQGDITLGVIGAEDRLDSSLISDQVILTGTLERLTGKFGVRLLTTQTTYLAADAAANARYIGKLLLDGQTLELYDVFAADEPEIARLKSETKRLFEEGVTFFQHGRFYDARERFVEVMRRYPQDLIALAYFNQSDEYLRTNVSLQWAGTLTVQL
ncbi:adenylate/guanylate cyclase domain-containing protein [Tumebacillus permanentifrigoris]|uniref:Class 3 adenylate cyclase n=1 Tax=Tumebacillus permanentifrigoris TaxID=378543 RepID=A0A316D7Y4_9BACL|nr:adenylate/guanylate cyclase domain-containing protein [Tumebacillus permanentifrigoris]PWK11541.1 class 3 adenylate cyclase [Tumebacillus permanentifrigoris]